MVLVSDGAVVKIASPSIGTVVRAVSLFINPHKLGRWAAAEIG